MEQVPMLKFLEMTKSDDSLVDTYKTIRVWLQKEGHTTESAKRISGAPAEIWASYHELNSKIEKLKRDLNNYGLLKGNERLFEVYIQNKLKSVDKMFPLIDEL